MTTKLTPGPIKATMKNGHKRHTSLHPTVDAEGYEIISAPALADPRRRLFYWLRGDDYADGDFSTQQLAEKSALAHLRSLPARTDSDAS